MTRLLSAGFVMATVLVAAAMTTQTDRQPLFMDGGGRYASAN